MTSRFLFSFHFNSLSVSEARHLVGILPRLGSCRVCLSYTTNLLIELYTAVPCWPFVLVLGVLYLSCDMWHATAFIQREAEEREDGEAPDTDANKYMPCLLAACSSGVPRVVATALDAIVKVGIGGNGVNGT